MACQQVCWPVFSEFPVYFLFPQEIKEGKVCLKQNLSTFIKTCNLIQCSCSISPQSWFISSWKCSSLGRMSCKNFGPVYCWFFVTCCSWPSQGDRAEILGTAQGDAFPRMLLLSTFWVYSTETFPEPKEKGDPENNLKIGVVEKWSSCHLSSLCLALSRCATPSKLPHCSALEKACLQVGAG